MVRDLFLIGQFSYLQLAIIGSECWHCSIGGQNFGRNDRGIIPSFLAQNSWPIRSYFQRTYTSDSEGVCCGQMASVPQLVSAIMVGPHLMTELTLKIMKNNAFVEGKVWRTLLIIWFLHVKYSGFLQFVPQFWSLTAKSMIQNSDAFQHVISFYHLSIRLNSHHQPETSRSPLPQAQPVQKSSHFWMGMLRGWQQTIFCGFLNGFNWI